MSANSKTYFAILVLAVVINTTAAAQDTTTLLNQPWQKLKTELQRKVDIAVNLTSIAGKSKKVDKILLDSVKSTAVNLSAYINSSTNLDSLTIQTTYHKNDNLSIVLSQVLVQLIDDPTFKSQNESITLQTQLEGAENRTAVAERNYNDACRKYKRFDLLFEKSK